jgi:DnaJ-class molecular chaperone
MSENRISSLVLNERVKCEWRLSALQEQATKAIVDSEKEIDGILANHGAVRCERCEGTGARERLDGSFMRRFGMRDWDGCEYCGGESETRGRGFNVVEAK